jgi:hypothetical protein
MKDKRCEHVWEIDFLCVLACDPPKYSAKCVYCNQVEIVEDLLDFMSNNKLYIYPNMKR